ncbi:MAG: hypothetical protein HRT71_09820 [Flavobacteriales bacterium]|nr:hypothetical protein [Flavobacteriales bacterium]
MLSRPEKWWVIAHPFVAKKAGIIAIKVKKSAKKVEEEGKLGSDYLGGRMDAFRHSYWMAMLAQDINPEKVKKLGEAHEKGNYLDFKKRRHEDGAVPDSMATVMDLWNNDVGIRIGTENKKLSREKLIAVVVAAIFEGEMKMMKKNDEKTYLDQDGNEIDLKDFDRQWRNPKCLVSTK